jgi:hypothetical protein
MGERICGLSGMERRRLDIHDLNNIEEHIRQFLISLNAGVRINTHEELGRFTHGELNGYTHEAIKTIS